MKILLTLLLIVISTVAFSAEQTYVREYTYKASDLDSKVTARSNALNLVKAGVLEEIITFVSSESQIGQQQLGDDYRSAFINQAKTQTAGFLRAYILEESWNGVEFWIKAKVTADPEKVKEELINSLSMVNQKELPVKTSKPVVAADPTPLTKSEPAPIPVEVHIHVDAPVQTSAQSPVVSPSTSATQVPAPVIYPSVTQDYSGYVLSAKFAQVFTLVLPIRMMAEQEHAMRGQWPTSLEQIGLKKNETSDGRYIDEVRLGENGAVIVLLSKEFGQKRILKLAPKSIMGGMHIRWQCATNLLVKTINALSSFNCETDSTLKY
jgi:hypothetical protein